MVELLTPREQLQEEDEGGRLWDWGWGWRIASTMNAFSGDVEREAVKRVMGTGKAGERRIHEVRRGRFAEMKQMMKLGRPKRQFV